MKFDNQVKRVPIKLLWSIIVIASLFFPLFSFGQTAYAACSGSACDGTDPQTTSCNVNAYALEIVFVTGITQTELRYSPTCNTTWSRVTNNTSNNNAAGARVSRQNPYGYNVQNVSNLIPGGNWWTLQYWRQSGSQSQAAGYVINTNYTAITGWW